ncbi:hypothetical protein B296_00029877 [Ensete ventricosum]|uniref:Eukaryotic translation initiation factor 3 subunit E N-terminal domain-containing protein n=1 Tax=Ensete ventricosum TaxID=4639 RepID=A0A426ZR63_ENSVE|nr:hypothetical protein B296_00029877 [Ensete ventricosum]
MHAHVATLIQPHTVNHIDPINQSWSGRTTSSVTEFVSFGVRDPLGRLPPSISHSRPSACLLSGGRSKEQTLENETLAIADYDLTSRIAPHLDHHLVFLLLEFLQERQLYADDEILKAKIQLLSQFCRLLVSISIMPCALTARET